MLRQRAGGAEGAGDLQHAVNARGVARAAGARTRAERSVGSKPTRA